MHMPYTMKFFVITYDIDSKSIFNIRRCHHPLCCPPLYRDDINDGYVHYLLSIYVINGIQVGHSRFFVNHNFRNIIFDFIETNQH